MRFSIGAFAAVASVSNAFLLPPNLTPTDKEIVEHGYDHTIPTDDRYLNVDCRDCPVRYKDLVGVVAYDVAAPFATVLQFNFSIARGEEHDSFLINGSPMYPLSPDYEPEILSANQGIKTGPNSFQYIDNLELGFGLSVERTMNPSKEGVNILDISFDVFYVGGNFVNSIPSIDLQLLETPTGKLTIVHAIIAQHLQGTAASAPAVPAPGQECTNFICKWKAIIAAKISKLKGSKGLGCGGRPSKHGSGLHKAGHGKHGSRPYAGRPHIGPAYKVHPHGSRPHHYHQRHGRFSRMVRAVVFHFVIPVLVGAAVGFAATILGLLVGHFAIFMWRLAFRRGQQGTAYRKAERDAAAAEESKSFIEHQSPPPVYKDTPAYEGAVDEKTPQ